MRKTSRAGGLVTCSVLLLPKISQVLFNSVGSRQAGSGHSSTSAEDFSLDTRLSNSETPTIFVAKLHFRRPTNKYGVCLCCNAQKHTHRTTLLVPMLFLFSVFVFLFSLSGADNLTHCCQRANILLGKKSSWL